MLYAEGGKQYAYTYRDLAQTVATADKVRTHCTDGLCPLPPSRCRNSWPEGEVDDPECSDQALYGLYHYGQAVPCNLPTDLAVSTTPIPANPSPSDNSAENAAPGWLTIILPMALLRGGR